MKEGDDIHIIEGHVSNRINLTQNYEQPLSENSPMLGLNNEEFFNDSAFHSQDTLRGKRFKCLI